MQGLAEGDGLAERERVGIVGVGRMGLAMLRHLVAHGFPVAACDVSSAQTEQARALGGRVAESPAALGRDCDFVIIGVGYDAEVNEVVLGGDGLLTTLAAGSVIAVSSTVAPATVKAIEEAARAKEIDVLDAPICRGRFAADAGTLLALFGGSHAVVERARPVFSAFCSDIAHLGAVGHGQVGKAMNNFLLWVNGVALIEAGRLATSTGIDLQVLREALLMSSGNSAALEDWEMVSFTWALKDMQIVSDMADQAGLSLPIAGAVRELVKEARRIKAESPPMWTPPGGRRGS
jgi:3-hydroxyisobutyrate dehydrogenase